MMLQGVSHTDGLLGVRYYFFFVKMKTL